MANIYRTPIERVAEELSKLTFSEMMAVSHAIRYNIMGEAKISDDGTYIILDEVQVALVLSSFAIDGNSAYEKRRREEID